ncbi:hypothetical protein AGLY_017684, partial [Aphis glycines]
MNSTQTSNETIDDFSNVSFASSSISSIDITPLGKSVVWKKFQTVMFVKQNIQNPDSPDEELLTDFVACINCKELYGKNTGTASLNRHKCAHELKSQKTIEVYTELMRKKKKIPTHLKNETIEKCVKFCCLDIRPMSAVNGEGFKSFSQFLLDTNTNENDKARIYKNIEVKLLQIESEKNSEPSNLLPEERHVPQKSSGSTPFSEWEDVENDFELFENIS